jgi:hypothetical protein
VRRAVIDGLLRVVEFEEAELQAAGEAVAAADAVEDFQLGIFAALVEFAVVPEIALQSFFVAVMTRRSVVAATLKFGYSFTAVSIIALNASVSMWLSCGPRP